MIRSKKLWLTAPPALASTLPVYYRIAGPSDASIDAAAVAPAHRILALYFPAQQAVNSQAAAGPCDRSAL